MILAPGARLGILGGGQLGRMLALAAARLGLEVHIFTDEADSPAARVASHTVCAPYSDEAALADFARGVDAITFEFENIPAASAQMLVAAGACVRPGPASLITSQDRLEEKRFLNRLGIPTAAFAPVDSAKDLAGALQITGLPAILKTRRLGYDGKGQARLRALEDAPAAFASLGGAPAILEAHIPFVREVSIIAARSPDGHLAPYDLSENTHENGVLATSICPAASGPQTRALAAEYAARLAHELDYVGIFAIEFFELADGGLLANEWAPRVHNSGHWTADACRTGQFEQHVRAVCGWPLGDPARLSSARMHNLLGQSAQDWAHWAGQPNARLWLYGKRAARDGRKMGHVTLLNPGGQLMAPPDR